MSAFDEVSAAIWRGYDVLENFQADQHAPDDQGWNSDHIFLTDTMTSERPRVVVELGVWKGASTMTMAATLREHGIDGCVVAVDTWLGSSEHWMKDMHRSDMRFENGYPRMYYTFLANIVANGFAQHVVPLPLDSANAAIVMRKSGVSADVVHIDGAHDYESTLSDLKRWWEILKPGGVMIVDDYDLARPDLADGAPCGRRFPRRDPAHRFRVASGEGAVPEGGSGGGERCA